MGRKKAALLAIPAALAIAGGTVILATRDDHDKVSAVEQTPSPSPTGTATVVLPTPTITPTPTPTGYFGIFDGMPMTVDEWNARKDLAPITVMIDNAPGAFPHYGLQQADIIYEALVESGITRLMAVYWRQEADRIEPIRSARTPFVIWTSELRSWYSHAGNAETSNAANAAGQIIEWGIPDLNALEPTGENAAYFRDNRRFAPHNLVTSTAALRAAGVGKGFGKPASLPASWLFKSDLAGTTAAPVAGGVEVNFSATRDLNRLSQWRYDATTNRYVRYTQGGPENDAITGTPLAVANVVVMRAQHYTLETSHVVYDQVGEGPVQVFLDGKVVEGKWKKTDREARTRFYDAGGKEIALNRGQTFVELVPLDALVTVAAEATGLPFFPSYNNTSPVQSSDGFNDFDDSDFQDFPTPRPAQPTATPGANRTTTPSTSQTPGTTATNRPGTPSVSQTPGPGATPTRPPASATAPGETPNATPPPTQPPATAAPTNPPATVAPTNPPATAAPTNPPLPTAASSGTSTP